eukprot:TRINITY_DN8808_c0_g1_i11.p1 TRINITY_DN8808_c0_g1~~TRINITY_DN8808_c0_g1_i11.p1  ORF type:complete len:442 (-),score=62.92 TRINITY_DN8808_c0_g1_i11:195-1520(-)
METNRVVVVDNGSYTIKAGFAGDDLPREVIRSVVGHPRRRGIIGQPFRGELIKENYYGTEALSRRGLLTLKRPIDSGKIVNWEDMELIWETVYSTLNVDPTENAFIHTESPLTDRSPQHRDKLAQIHFETFGVPALFVGVDAFLSLYASGRQTGVVVQSGHDMTYSVPIFEGKIVKPGCKILSIGGRDITDYLMKISCERGYSFTTTAERAIINECKEQFCFVSLDFESDMYKMSREPDYLLAEYPVEGEEGHPVLFQNERCRSPEVLFQSCIMGTGCHIHEMVYSSIMKIEQQRRNDMWKNIVLAGGSTFFELIEEQTAQPPFYDKVHAMAEGNTESATNNRFCSLPSELVGVILNYSQVKVRTELASLRTRLHKDLLSLAPSNTDINVIAPPTRKISAWQGGSKIGSHPAFSQIVLTKEQYDEVGPSAINSCDVTKLLK